MPNLDLELSLMGSGGYGGAAWISWNEPCPPLYGDALRILYFINSEVWEIPATYLALDITLLELGLENNIYRVESLRCVFF